MKRYACLNICSEWSGKRNIRVCFLLQCKMSHNFHCLTMTFLVKPRPNALLFRVETLFVFSADLHHHSFLLESVSLAARVPLKGALLKCVFRHPRSSSSSTCSSLGAAAWCAECARGSSTFDHFSPSSVCSATSSFRNGICQKGDGPAHAPATHPGAERA